jgi:hypothetical protein
MKYESYPSSSKCGYSIQRGLMMGVPSVEAK